MPPQIIIALIGVAALIIVLGIFGSIREKKRREEIAAWGASKGLSFSEDKVRGVDDEFPEFSCLKQGSDRYAFNILQGQLADSGFLGFDYHYETTSTDNEGHRQTHDHYFSAIILSPAFPLKTLSIRTENFFDKIGQFLGADDIDFESAEFSRQFCVNAVDRKWAYDVIHQRAMEFLLAQPRFSIEFDTAHIIVHNGCQYRAADYANATAVATGLVEMMPPYLVKQQKELMQC